MLDYVTGGRGAKTHLPDYRRDTRFGVGHIPSGENVEAQGHAGALRLRPPLLEAARDFPRAHQEVCDITN